MTAQSDLATLNTNLGWISDWVAQAATDLTANPSAVSSDLACAKSYVAAAQQAAAALGVDINQTPPPPPPPLVLVTPSNVSATVGTAITPITLNASGGTPAYTFTATGLPTGLMLSGNVISGTPSVATTTRSVSIMVTDTGTPTKQTVTKTFSITVAAVTPPPTGKPIWGEYHAGSHYAYTPTIMLDYAYNNASTYPQSAAQNYTNQGKRLMLKVGNLTQSQATAIAQALVAGGQANAIVPIMWENNQGVNGWETAWNENAMTAQQFITNFNNICGWMRAVPGAKFTFAYCPNVNQVGNQKTGRTQTDTFPGTGVNGDIVVAPDGYDNPGDMGSGAAGVIAQAAPFEQLAAQHGAKFAGFCECGNNGSDDPTYWTDLLTHAETQGYEWIVNFQATTSQGGAFNSVTGPNSVAAIKAFYAA